MKSHTINHEIVAMQAKMVHLKGKLALSKDVEQAGTEKKGERTKKQYQKEGRGMKESSTPGMQAIDQKIRNKDFHWCVHHMAWTVHLP